MENNILSLDEKRYSEGYQFFKSGTEKRRMLRTL